MKEHLRIRSGIIVPTLPAEPILNAQLRRRKERAPRTRVQQMTSLLHRLPRHLRKVDQRPAGVVGDPRSPIDARRAMRGVLLIVQEGVEGLSVRGCRGGDVEVPVIVPAVAYHAGRTGDLPDLAEGGVGPSFGINGSAGRTEGGVGAANGTAVVGVVKGFDGGVCKVGRVAGVHRLRTFAARCVPSSSVSCVAFVITPNNNSYTYNPFG
mmetsp:Transcript_2350/g.5088  ORF Transcript_2350/g.5088 Transcript_2350/m.5088 type:complete len:209 (-) Transcript_2350:743-1369(-)